MNEGTEQQILTLAEVADYLHISLAQVYRFVDREVNPLPVIFISDKTKRVRMTDLQNWLTQQQKEISNDSDSGKGGEQ
jgi:predicted DNA-binding transcriptional regulator AlpA